MVNKKTHHIKQPRKPADYKDDVYGKNIIVHEFHEFIDTNFTNCFGEFLVPDPLKGELIQINY